MNVVCRNHSEDRVLPRFARYLAAELGWELTAAPIANADVTYLMGYFEVQVCRQWPPAPRVACLFTHREEEPALARKTALFDEMAGRVDLRLAMCRKYARLLEDCGPTVETVLPVERDRFVPAPRPTPSRPVVGLSGYTYAGRRKGEDLARALMNRRPGVDWTVSGAGWHARAQRRPWSSMPAFYQSLDVLVCPSRVEGGPMPVLEALACGVKVVVPRGVGVVDELPDVPGVVRYACGDVNAMAVALDEALDAKADPADLCEATARYSVRGWAQSNSSAVEALR